ncbi:MAG: TetR/AcrR family transcriptional regulator [Lachnospiraceae bacterium]|nr:TetR/AcrR family transcriptional regulator [Lachnospiraceae bacterium]
MPKSTFFKIPIEKQLRICEAAQKEFASTPFEEASINKIIKEADIPRGSFYQYFEDKLDLFDYCFEKERMEIVADLIETLNRCKGDVFDCVTSYIDPILDSAINNDMCMINMLINNSIEFEENIMGIIHGKVANSGKSIYDYMSIGNLKVDESDMPTFYIMIIGIVIENINRIQYKKRKGTLESDREIVKKEFLSEISLMKKAFSK